MFVHGEYIDYTFPTDPEPVSILAQVIIDGDTLEFRDIAVYCGQGDKRVMVGVGRLLRVRKEIEDSVRKSGYNRLIITGDRHTGAYPNHDVRVERKLR